MLPEDVLAQIPEEYRDNEALKQFNDIGALAKSYVETKALQGQSIRIPPESAGPEAKAEFLDRLINTAPELMKKPDFTSPEQSGEFWKTLGTPEAPDKYENPADLNLASEVEAELRQVLHHAHATPQQYQAVMQAFSDNYAKTLDNLKSAHETDVENLKGEWGATFEDRLNTALKINEERNLYPNMTAETLGSGELKNLWALHEDLTGKGPQVATQSDGQPQALTPQEATRRAAEIMRRVHAPDSDLSHEEKMDLINERIDMLRKYTDIDKPQDVHIA